MTNLILSGVRKSFGDLEVIHSVDLSVEAGEFVVFVGPSGCGKSTLLRLIAGLEEVSGGDITIDDTVVTNIDAARRGIAMVFQSYALYPHMTVRKNLGFGLKMTGHPKADIPKQVDNVSRILQLETLLDRKPKQLSGGQRQRVAIGRALVRKPKIFLFDEPLSNLDAELRAQMRVEIARLHKELGITTIFVTHDQVEAMTLANRIVVMNKGNIEQVGSPLELYDNPANRFVAGFIGSPKMNFFDMRVLNNENGKFTFELSDGVRFVNKIQDSKLSKGARAVVGIRPEHVRRSEDSSDIRMTIDFVEHLGGVSYLHGSIGDGQRVTVESRMSRDIIAGSSLYIEFPPEHSLIFDEQGERLI